jgi:hypothetical protein
MTLFAAPPPLGSIRRYSCARGYLHAVRAAYKQDRSTWGYPEGFLIAWVGGAYDSKRNRTWISRGGGHNDGGNNDTQALDWETLGDWMDPLLDGTDPLLPGEWPVDSPLCPSHTSRIPQSSSQPVVNFYSDGKPASRHVGFGVRYCPAEDFLWTWGGSAYGTTPGPDKSVMVWDPKKSPTAPDPGMWTRMADSPHQPDDGGANVYRARTGEILAINSSGELAAHKLSTNTWRRFDGQLPPAIWSTALALDPGRDVLLWLGTGQAYALGVATYQASYQDIKAHLPAELVGCGMMGLEYAPQIDRFVAWIGGRKVYLINPQNWSCTIRELAGDDPGDIYNNSATMRGCYGRFHIFPQSVSGDTGKQVTFGLIMYLDAVHMGRFEGNGDAIPTTPPPVTTTPPPPVTTTPKPGAFTQTVVQVPYMKQTMLVADAPVMYRCAIFDATHHQLAEQHSNTKMVEYVFNDADVGRAPKTGDYAKAWQEKAGGTPVGGSLTGLVPIDIVPTTPPPTTPPPTTPPPQAQYDVVDTSGGIVGKLTMYRR